MHFLNALWYKEGVASWPLVPFSILYNWVTILRRKLYRAGILAKHTFSVPVIVVGNITVGGTGKAPY